MQLDKSHVVAACMVIQTETSLLIEVMKLKQGRGGTRVGVVTKFAVEHTQQRSSISYRDGHSEGWSVRPETVITNKALFED
ncbi:hypothetical protein ACFQDN_19850 [Pseudomonas asuensis]|uniref:Uncharacterized protein n=1 Tax=Pseudomonas asuensis TaxID=1825787 RepID=A0ABQ2H460_9PSED|nr:hypothetical protein [Pseudomonas asuensis]GGM30689.1 hypothetical protein GCM10009425_46650 [Pseudomonas asuensis]